NVRHNDLHAPVSSMPTPTAKPDRLFASLSSFSKYQETFHAIDDREKTDCTDTSKRPRWSITELARSHACLNTFSDDQIAANSIELHRSPTHDAEHPSLSLRPVLRLVQSNAVHARNFVVIKRPERSKKCRNLGQAGVFVPPRTTRMEAQHSISEIVGKFEGARLEIVLCCSTSRVLT